MTFNKTIEMTLFELNGFAESVASQVFSPVCGILSYSRVKELTQNGHTISYKLKIAIPYRRTPPYNLIREDSQLSFVHKDINFGVQGIETVLNGMGRPTQFIFDLINTQEVLQYGN